MACKRERQGDDQSYQVDNVNCRCHPRSGADNPRWHLAPGPAHAAFPPPAEKAQVTITENNPVPVSTYQQPQQPSKTAAKAGASSTMVSLSLMTVSSLYFTCRLMTDND